MKEKLKEMVKEIYQPLPIITYLTTSVADILTTSTYYYIGGKVIIEGNVIAQKILERYEEIYSLPILFSHKLMLIPALYLVGKLVEKLYNKISKKNYKIWNEIYEIGLYLISSGNLIATLNNLYVYKYKTHLPHVYLLLIMIPMALSAIIMFHRRKKYYIKFKLNKL
jgi:uncharacterized membrane protein